MNVLPASVTSLVVPVMRVRPLIVEPITWTAWADVLVSVPRRQYWGREAYAEQWGYDAAEMNRRRALRDRLVGPEATTTADETSPDLAPLRAMGAPVYLIVRAEDVGAGPFASWGEAHPAFREVHASAGIRLFRLD